MTSTQHSISTTMSIPATAAAGGMTFTKPAQTAAPSFFKIAPNNVITLGWNLTSLYSTPTYLTFSAYCSLNGNTYAVGPTNGVVPATQSSLTWDPYQYNQSPGAVPLAEASYTLHVVDERGPNVGPSPGLFMPNTQVTFALYKPQSYTPLASGWTCTACTSSASAAFGNPAFLGVMVSVLVMVLSGWHLLRNGFGGRQ